MVEAPDEWHMTNQCEGLRTNQYDGWKSTRVKKETLNETEGDVEAEVLVETLADIPGKGRSTYLNSA